MTGTTLAPCSFANIAVWCQDTTSLFLLIAYVTVAILSGVRITRFVKGQGRGKAILLFSLPILAMSLLILTWGLSLSALKGFFLFALLLQASISDLKTRQVPDTISAMILLTALIGIQPESLPAMLFGLFIVALPQLIIAMIKPGTYGGADIKLTAASAFLLGAGKGLFAIIIGLLCAIIVPAIIRLLKKQSLKEGIPMIPYLSFGIFLAYIL